MVEHLFSPYLRYQIYAKVTLPCCVCRKQFTRKQVE